MYFNMMEEILKFGILFHSNVQMNWNDIFLTGRKWTHNLRVAWNGLGAILL